MRGIYFFLFICLCVLFFVKIATHRVSGVSMMPTLENKDYLFIIKGKKPSRYSLVTFAPKKHSADSYVKRILGLPGDRIWLDKNTVYLNHQMAQSNPTPENELQLSGSDLPDGTLKVRVTWEVASKLQGLEKIPEGQYFVLGDNRNHSNDSRHLGLIDQKQIEGVVSFRYYPLNRIGLID
ncbi:signal peptidase I [Candidatus Enterococcus mansonii]|uniref:signal peptidase I n=1 Tax=Candidatus Enterococcus mansonii TaxID=1834181 RepID=UPI00301454E6